MADQSKMAASTLATTTDSLNVPRCASPSASTEPRETTPPRPSTPITAVVTTDDRPLEGEWQKVLSRKKSTHKKPTRASTPKEQPVLQRRKTPSPPKKVQRVKSPVLQVPSGQEKKTTTGAGRAFPLHEKYDLDEVVSGITRDKRKYYIVKANRLPRFEEELNVDLPAYFMHIHKEEDPRPRWLFVKGPTSKAYNKIPYEKMERFYKQARPCGDAVCWIDLLDRSSQGSDPTAPAIQKVTPDAATSRPFSGPLACLSGVNLHCALVDYSNESSFLLTEILNSETYRPWP